MTERPSWDEYFIKLVNEVAKRATCDRKSHRVIVRGAIGLAINTGKRGTDIGCEKEQAGVVEIARLERSVTVEIHIDRGFFQSEARIDREEAAEGQVDIHDRGRRFNLLQAGDAFGEMSILDPAPRSAAATAFSDCLLLRLDQESFRDLLNDHSEIAWGVMQLLTQRLRNLMNQDSTEAIGEEAPEAAAG